MFDINDISVYEDLKETPVPDFFELEIDISDKPKTSQSDDNSLATKLLDQ